MGFLVTEFLVILGGTILVSGVITGTYRAFQKIYGVSYPALFGDPEKILHEGILPVLILKTGVFSILGLGLSSIFIFSTLRKIEAKMLFFAISIGNHTRSHTHSSCQKIPIQIARKKPRQENATEQAIDESATAI